MRVMVKFRIPVEGGNESVRSGRINTILGKIMEDLKPEAAYFYSEGGWRAGLFVVSMNDSSEVFQIGERLWIGLGAEVELVPVMAADDIKKGLESAGAIVQRFG
jgi:hypothetical protein